MGTAVSWNHRLVQSTDESGDKIYSVHEIHYDRDRNIVGWNPNAVPLSADSPEQLLWINAQVDHAVKHPMLLLQEDGSLIEEEGD